MSFTIVKGVVRESCIEGKGFFVEQDIAKGALIGFFDGVVRRFRMSEECADIPDYEDIQAIDLAVDDGWLYVLVPVDREILSGVDYINHSCTPNCLVEGYLKIVAARDIRCGEELTIDYGSLTLVKEKKRCNCRPGCSYIL